MVNKFVDLGAKILTAVGALNWGTSQFLNFDVLSFVPGVWSKVAVALITASGGYVVYLLWKKRI